MKLEMKLAGYPNLRWENNSLKVHTFDLATASEELFVFFFYSAEW